MRSYQIIEFGRPLEARDAPTPEPQGSQVLVRVEACGVCHSDLHIWQGYFDLGGGKRITLSERGVVLPFTLGHEIVGEVAALGPEARGLARGLKVGDKRVVYPWVGCGDCAPCERGEQLLCETPHNIGTRRDGGYSDHVLVPDARFLFDYAGVPKDLACTYACSGLTAFSALKKAAPFLGAGDSLVIIGAGGVGLGAVRLAPLVLENPVVVADLDPDKRDAAATAGAAHVVDNGAPDALDQVRELTGNRAAVAIDFVGTPASVRFGLDLLCRGGALVVVGLHGGALPVSIALFPLKMLRIIGSFVGSLEEMRQLMDLARAGKVGPIPVTPRPMAEANGALEDLKSGKVIGRVVLRA